MLSPSPSFPSLCSLGTKQLSKDLVMATVKPQIESGELHALSIKTFTPEQRAEGAE